MALFKINRGNSSNLPATMTDGWAYFCTDTAEFFIDYADSNGKLFRKQINADEAKKITGLVGSENQIVSFDSNGNLIAQNNESGMVLNNITSSLPNANNWDNVFYGNGVYIALARYDTIYAYSTDGITWTQGTLPFSTYNSPCIAYGNGKFVLVGSNGTSAACSEDGISWTLTTLPVSESWASITYGDGKFVAIASGDQTNVAAYSTDGVNWSEATLPTSVYWTSVSYGNGMFVAISEYTINSSNDSNVAAYSKDGINWTETVLPGRGRWTSVIHENGVFVAICFDRDFFAYSTDGITWIESTVPRQYWHLITYGCGKFVVFDNNTNNFIYSADGMNWNEATLPVSANWSGLTYGNSMFIAIGTSGTIIATSYDGITWKVGKDIVKQDGVDITSDIASALYRRYTVSDIGDLTASAKEINCLDGVTSNVQEQLDAVNECANGHVNNSDIHVTADDKANWNEAILLQNVNITLPESDSWQDIAYNGDVFVAIAFYSDIAAYSVDGIVWTKTSMPKESKWISVVYGNDKFVAIGYSIAAYSEDGINWTEITMPSCDYDFASITYGNGKFVVVSEGGNTSFYSEDGITWNQTTMPSISLWICVYYGGDKFVAIARNSKNAAYSTDGINWAGATLPDSSYWLRVAYGDNKFLAVARDTNKAAYSIDGITWERVTLPSSGFWKSCAYSNGLFVIIKYNSNEVIYSRDCINWELSTLPVSANWNDLYYGNGKFVAVAGGSNAIVCSYDGINWFTSTNILETVSGNIVTSDVKNALGFGAKADTSAMYTQSEVDALIAAVRDACMPKFTTVTIASDEWSYDSSEYYYDVVLDCLTSNTQVNLQADASSLSVLQDDGIALTPVCYSSYVRIWTIGGAPREDITVQMTIQQVMGV